MMSINPAIAMLMLWYPLEVVSHYLPTYLPTAYNMAAFSYLPPQVGYCTETINGARPPPCIGEADDGHYYYYYGYIYQPI